MVGVPLVGAPPVPGKAPVKALNPPVIGVGLGVEGVPPEPGSALLICLNDATVVAANKAKLFHSIFIRSSKHL